MASVTCSISEFTVEWTHCFICQSSEINNLQDPSAKKGFNPIQNSYHTIADNLKQFESINGLPRPLQRRCSQFRDKEDLFNHFISNKARFHKTCISSYDKQKLTRKRKKYEKIQEENKKKRNEDEFEEEMPQQTIRATRRSLDSKTAEIVCFFCENTDTSENLHKCQTLHLHNKINYIANTLNDTAIMAKLSQGDMVAIDAAYHNKCLVAYNNKFRALKKKNSEDSVNDKIASGIALSYVVNYIEEKIFKETELPIFMLKDVRQLYQERLKELGVATETVNNVNVTRLKEDIIEQIPGLCEQKNGRFVFLTVEKEVGKTLLSLSQNTLKDDGLVLSKAAKIVRKYMFLNDETFDGDLSQKKQLRSVDGPLFHLMSLILHGDSSVENGSAAENITVNMAQLVRFNSVKWNRRGKSQTIRHSKYNEPPLPVKIGMIIHAKTRKRSIVDTLHADGLSISYTRLQDIQGAITKQMCDIYHEEGIVCPPPLKNGLFTTAAIDNIDHDKSSSTASDSFHGTSISVFQHLEVPEKDDLIFKLSPSSFDKQMSVSKTSLPKDFTEVIPIKECKPEYPKKPSSFMCNTPEKAPVMKIGNSWLEELAKSGSTDRVSFSAYHSNALDLPQPNKDTSVLLPLFSESINSPAMVFHCLKIIKKLIAYLNPSQNPVITADQPVYAVAKQIQWQYPEMFSDTMIMLGPLHIEMALLSAIGNWLEGSGWTDMFTKAEINTPGRVESFLTGSHVKRNRFAHQISLATLSYLSRKAFEEQNEIESYKEWKEKMIKSSPTACYWFKVMELELLLFIFIRSLRAGDIDLFINCLEKIIPWMFALDHTHYSRWLPIFLEDLKCLDESSTTLQNFRKGFFTVSRSRRVFSRMGIDQAHEQNNKLVKIDGGAIGILGDDDALLKWAVSGPVICKLLEEIESSRKHHHENTESFEKDFREKVRLLGCAFDEVGNPFLEEGNSLIHLVSKQVLSEEAKHSVINAEEIGKQQFTQLLSECILSSSSSIYDTIKKNKLPLFRQKNAIVTSKSKQKIVSLAADRRLYASLYVVCQSREGDLENFFQHENHSFPVSLSEYGHLRKCSKSDFLKCLQEIIEPSYEPPTVEVKIVDGAAFVYINKPRASETFGQYCDELTEKIKLLSTSIERLDLVFDVYKEDSLKSETRESRGVGVRTVVRKNTPIPRKFQDFMRNNENKTELFTMIANEVVTRNQPGTTIIATSHESVISNEERNFREIEPCNHEEADTRLILHAHDASRSFKKVSIITVDTDVVVIAMYHFFDLNLDELWIEIGVGQHRRWLPIHSCARALGEETCRALPFWFTLTGCDTVSAFSGRGKKTAWNVWGSCSEVTQSFVRLGTEHGEISSEDFKNVERFVVLLYDRVSSLSAVNDCRRQLFTQKARAVEQIPPSQDALLQHVKRATLQSRIWTMATSKQIAHFNITEWGWKKGDKGIEPIWITLPEAAKSCYELIKCGCKTKCVRRCKCKTQGLACTELCGCGGGCVN